MWGSDERTYDEIEREADENEASWLRYLEWYERVGFDAERSDAEATVNDTEES